MRYTFIFLLMIATTLVYAQVGVQGDLKVQTEVQVAVEAFSHESSFYAVQSSISKDHARSIANILDAYVELFSTHFHFDPNTLDHKLGVRIFDKQTDYEQYLFEAIEERREEFVYLHNSNPARSLLVGAVEDGSAFDPTFVHQAFVQYIRAFISNPPLWLREGFAIYFEETRYNNGVFEKNTNLSWLETLKAILLGERRKASLSIEETILVDLEEAEDSIDVFYPQSWGLVYYLLNTDNRSHNRILWDSITAMNTTADLETNSQNVLDTAFNWVDLDDFSTDLRMFYTDSKTYAELIEEATVDYELGELASAKEKMQMAVARKGESFIPYYYLGLISYDNEDYSSAESYYQEAIERGQSEALVYYALGLNAFADKQYEKAESYFATTLELDGKSFSEKITQIRERIATEES